MTFAPPGRLPSNANTCGARRAERALLGPIGAAATPGDYHSPIALAQRSHGKSRITTFRYAILRQATNLTVAIFEKA